MSDRHWSAIGDLLFENWNNRAATTKYISKSHDRKRAPQLPSRIENDHFRQSFGGAINGGGSNRLVSGDQNKSFHLVIEASLHNIPRAQYVIRDCLDYVHFHQWDMLVGRGMKDN